mgnify:CR=1 FL=1
MCFGCEKKIGSSRDKEVEESKLAAAAAVALEEGSVFGDGTGEANPPAVATAVEGICCCWCCHEVRAVIVGVEERRNGKEK